MRGERGGRAEPGVGDAATRIARRVAERGSARLASGGSPRAASGGGSNRAPSPRISKTRKTRSPSASRASRFRRGAGRSTLGAIASRARAREKRDVRRERRARISFVGISIEGVVRTAATFMSQPSLSSPSVKLAYPRVASCASSSSAICSRLFWFFQSPSPPPLPRRCACPLPRPASPYMFPLERPPVFPLNAGWPPGAPMARVREIEGKAETEFFRPPEARAERAPPLAVRSLASTLSAPLAQHTCRASAARCGAVTRALESWHSSSHREKARFESCVRVDERATFDTTSFSSQSAFITVSRYIASTSSRAAALENLHGELLEVEDAPVSGRAVPQHRPPEPRNRRAVHVVHGAVPDVHDARRRIVVKRVL